MKIYSVTDVPQKQIIDFFKTHWGTTEMVISSGVYDCRALDGLTVIDEKGEIKGFITYIIKDQVCEIISLDSIKEGEGIGTSLIQEVEKRAIKETCKLLQLVTTNDNLDALKFFQKRGFVLSHIINNAVEKARKIKPEIPFIGHYGIPIRDEIVLIKKLSSEE
ncbi:GNAT family N-acetyltransferase [Bacillus sp. 179-C3.3 HS]|uniref:GNAT family N-acetyltransferase n=1 Tax=Bacillus sp. 179-C3.3 HS TaxID=3232162 RepID=UPI0039A33634